MLALEEVKYGLSPKGPNDPTIDEKAHPDQQKIETEAAAL